jgi:BCD family chlorophyll transporter-like MFS transporter
MNWRKVAQLTLIHVGVSITVVPITSTLNRVMIADLKIPAILVSLLVALPYLLSPLQVTVGNWADRHPIFGRHRAPWIVAGGLMAALGSYFTSHTAYWIAADFTTGMVAAVIAFTVWGVGVNVASVSYLSLVTELANEEWRSRAISVMWTVMILSTIGTSLALARMLTDYSPEALYTAFGLIWLIASLLILLGGINIEPSASERTQPAQNSADNPLVAFRLLAGNPVARQFFVYLVLILISIHAQDVLLEPFGAEAMGMSVATTSRLTSIWGAGVFIALLGSLPLLRRWGKKRSANVGAAVAAGAFALISVTGILGATGPFMVSVFLLGLGGGLMTVSNLSFMLDMTVPEAAGLYIGAWGVANFAGQAVGNVISGALRDTFYLLTGNPLVGYIAVFGMEIMGLLAAIWLFRSIDVAEFRRNAELRLHEVLALAGSD